ncbi:Ubiquinone biosynthesis protein coq9, mitochondrial [Golovinomyces cichoracearum]|uniref:Ubiquinone biosynthesis protein n=1 Tax=Golovinomyces cichoracearum TaxID=62708 RepID=A0A420IE17_9PEZI|nr:Ubiquinone biosynthesis protein coq9, mitochondrial [Golovinomyces cichoracearum]
MIRRVFLRQDSSHILPRLCCISGKHPSIRSYHSYDHTPPPGPFTPIQSQILAAAQPHISTHGFTMTSLSRGANDVGYIDATTNLFSDGSFSLVHYHLYSQRLALKSRLDQVLQDKSQTVGFKVKALAWERLKGNTHVIHCWPEALALMALPSNIPVAMNELSSLVDEIWFLSGDVSVDTSWYTKRASLATIYTSTELFMTLDKSSDYNDTKQFLERRFEDTRSLGSAVKAISQWGSFNLNAIVNILRSRGVRI